MYELKPSRQGYNSRVLASFQDSFQENGGAFPDGSLILDNAGNFYGTTETGGAGCLDGGGCGVVFRLKS